MLPARNGGRICRSVRSAKSVACSRLKVVGVNMSFFLPRLVVSRTRGEEFHWLNTTPRPRDRSHWLSSDNWVDFPEPSMPSTMISLPGNFRLENTRMLPVQKGGYLLYPTRGRLAW